MDSFRIHSSRPSKDRIAYLALEPLGANVVRLDFRPMEEDSKSPLVLNLTHSVLYGLLEGKEAIVDLPGQRVELHPRAAEIVIDCRSSGNRLLRQYRIWTSELALAWNMLQEGSRADQTGWHGHSDTPYLD